MCTFVPEVVLALGGNFQPENTFVDDVYNTNTKVASSNDTAIDTVNHRFFVLDEENNRVLVYNLNASNEFIDRVADNVLGQANFYQNSFGTTNKKFNEPSSIEIDLDNSRLFVADSENHRVLVFDVTTVTNAESAINVLGQPDFTTGTSGVTDSKMDTPNGLAYDSNRDYLFVSDSANLRVTIFDTGHISNGDSYISYLGTPFLSGIGDMVFGATSGLFFEDKNKLLFVSDFLNNRVLVFDLVSITNGEAATHVLCQPDMMSNGSGTTASTCSFPFSVVGDSLNGTYIYVGDAGNARVLKFDINTLTNGEPAVSVLGQSDFTSNTQNVTQSGLSSVYGLSILPDSILYVSDKEAHRTMIFDVTAIVDGEDAVDGLGHIDANGDMDFSLSDAPSLSNYILGSGGQGGVALDSQNQYLYVVDSSFNRVLVYGTTNGLITSETTELLIGQLNTINISPSTTDSGLSTPMDVDVDSSGNVYIADTANSRVLVFDVVSIGAGSGPSAVHVLGQPDFTTNSMNLTADGLNTPTAVEVDSINNLLYVADSQNHRVVVYDISTITDGEPAVHVLGQPDFVTDDGLVTNQHSISSVTGLALDEENQRLFVADDNRVMVFDVSTIIDGEDAVAVLGAPDYTDSSESVAQDDFSNVYDVTFDEGANVLYTVETGSNRVHLFDVETIDSGESAVGVIGQTDFTTSSSTTEIDGFDFPVSVYFEPTTRRLYVRESNNNRIAIYVIPTLTTSSITSVATVGQSYTQTFISSDTQGVESLEVVSGTLPDGLSITNNVLSGTPTISGTYTFTVRIADGVVPGDIYTNQKTFSITVSNPAPSGGGGSSGSVPYACNDNQDNDGDGVSDYPFDVGCESYTDQSENNSPVVSLFACNDAGDNDGDGFVDMTDPGCSSPFDNNEFNSPITLPVCNDGIDNDADGKIDFQNGILGDPGCISPFDSSELNTQIPSETPENENPDEDNDTDPVVETDFGNPDENSTNQLPEEDIPTTPQGDTTNVLGTTDRCDYDLPAGASVVTVIRNEIVHTYCIVREVFDTTHTQIEQVLAFSDTNPLAQIIAIVGLVMGALFSVAPTLFLNPFSFTEVVFIPYRIWTLILNAFGLKKRNRPWGTVYDSVTKQPLDPVIVSLYDMNGLEVATSITDMDGRYGFLVPPGIYKMVAKKTHYQFPSTKLAGKTRDELYLDLYYGTEIEVKSQGDVLIKNIPLDPVGFDWNEFAKRDQKLMRFFSKKDLVIARIADAFFGIGFLFSVIALLTGPTFYNIFIFATYIFFMVVRETGVSRKSFGSVVTATGSPVSFAIMRIFTAESNTEVAHKVTNELGKYFCLIQNGKYYFTIEKKNSDESYTKVYTSASFDVTNGLIRERVTIS